MKKFRFALGVGPDGIIRPLPPSIFLSLQHGRYVPFSGCSALAHSRPFGITVFSTRPAVVAVERRADLAPWHHVYVMMHQHRLSDVRKLWISRADLAENPHFGFSTEIQ